MWGSIRGAAVARHDWSADVIMNVAWLRSRAQPPPSRRPTLPRTLWRKHRESLIPRQSTTRRRPVSPSSRRQTLTTPRRHDERNFVRIPRFGYCEQRCCLKGLERKQRKLLADWSWRYSSFGKRHVRPPSLSLSSTERYRACSGY